MKASWALCSLAPLAGRGSGGGASSRLLAPASRIDGGLPLTRNPRWARLPTSSRKRGEVIGCAVEGASGNCFDQLIDARFRRHSLGDHRGNSLESKAMLDPVADSFADEDRGPVFLVQPFKASRQIHAVAQCGIIHPLRRTHISDHGIPEMNAKANGERRQSLGFELSIERVARCLGRKGGATRPLDMIELRMGSGPKNQHTTPQT